MQNTTKNTSKIWTFRKKYISLQSNSKEEVNIRGVAQLASASGLGPEGPVFESQYPDIKEETEICFLLVILSQHRQKLKAQSRYSGCFCYLCKRFCSGVGIGRQEGLKIPWAEMPVRVRSPSGAPRIPVNQLISRDLFLSRCTIAYYNALCIVMAEPQNNQKTSKSGY